MHVHIHDVFIHLSARAVGRTARAWPPNRLGLLALVAINYNSY